MQLLDYESVQAGDELFNNYAPKQNDELLLGYGFCLRDNPVEQFAIRMALPPQLEDQATKMNLFSPASVAFGMNTDFLAGNPAQEQHYLRPIGHPFGRYKNNVAYLRSVPPWIGK